MLDRLQQHESEFAAVLGSETGTNHNNFLSGIKAGSSKIPPQLAVEIYRNNTRAARVSALEQIYPVCRKILGQEVFLSIAREYVTDDHQGSADLNTYGKMFFKHLYRLVKSHRLPLDFLYLKDLARLEFMHNSAYYADDDPVFDFDRFEHAVNHGIDIRLQLSNTLGLIASEFPLYRIWTNNRHYHDVGQVAQIEHTQHLVVYREVFRPAIEHTGTTAFRLLEAIQKGLSLKQLARLAECAIDQQLAELVAKRWIVGIK